MNEVDPIDIIISSTQQDTSSQRTVHRQQDGPSQPNPVLHKVHIRRDKVKVQMSISHISAQDRNVERR